LEIWRKIRVNSVSEGRGGGPENVVNMPGLDSHEKKEKVTTIERKT